jgi:hypothetical protein
MHIRKDMLACAIALTFAAGGTALAAPQHSASQPLMHQSQQRATTGQATSSAAQLNLTAQQKQQLFQAAQRLPQQNAGSTLPAVGSPVPSNVKLSAIPSSAKSKLGGAAKNSEIAKLQNGDVIVANPKTKMVQAVITPADANSTTGQGAANGINTNPNHRK